jgi:hypothetical protein
MLRRNCSGYMNEITSNYERTVKRGWLLLKINEFAGFYRQIRLCVDKEGGLFRIDSLGHSYRTLNKFILLPFDFLESK